MDDVLTALNLPALEVLHVFSFHHKGGFLQPDQLCCPQLWSLALDLGQSVPRAGDVSRQCCSLLSLARLTTLTIIPSSPLATLDLVLPASLTRLTMENGRAHFGGLTWARVPKMTLSGALLEAAKCIRGGAQLRSLTCAHSLPSLHAEGMPWGSSSIARYKELGEQLNGLTDLSVYGSGPTLPSAIGVVARSTPSLTRLNFSIHDLRGMALPPICSVSLRSITGLYWLLDCMPLQPVMLTFLAGCTQLQEVHVQFGDTTYMLKEGASVRIRCHCNSQRGIMPFVGRSEFVHGFPWQAGPEEVGVRFMPTPASPQGVQPYTVVFAFQSAGPEQALKWGHVIVPGVL